MSLGGLRVLTQPGVGEAAVEDLKRRRVVEVYVLEGRPDLSDARRLTRRLLALGMTPIVVPDGAAGLLFREGRIDEAWISIQDRTPEGAVCDTGALVLGVLGRRHRRPVRGYPAARRRPVMGDPERLVHLGARRTAPEGVTAYAPSVEWVPKRYLGRRHG